MYVLAGMGTQIFNDIYAGQYICPKCGQMSDFHLKKVKNVGSMFFIPFVFVTASRLMVCDICNAAVQMKKPEYEKIRKEQQNKLDNNQFPTHIIQQDYNPKALKLRLKKGLFIFTIIFTVMSLGLGLLLTFPIIISFAKTVKKHGYYKKLTV